MLQKGKISVVCTKKNDRKYVFELSKKKIIIINVENYSDIVCRFY